MALQARHELHEQSLRQNTSCNKNCRKAYFGESIRKVRRYKLGQLHWNASKYYSHLCTWRYKVYVAHIHHHWTTEVHVFADQTSSNLLTTQNRLSAFHRPIHVDIPGNVLGSDAFCFAAPVFRNIFPPTINNHLASLTCILLSSNAYLKLVQVACLGLYITTRMFVRMVWLCESNLF